MVLLSSADFFQKKLFKKILQELYWNVKWFGSRSGATFCRVNTVEACIGVLRIQDICHFTSRDIGYYPFYFQGYGILCSIFPLLSGILNI